MSRKFLVRRTRDNMSVVFERRARRTGTHPLGNLEAISERTGKVSIRNNGETERRGFDFWEIRNVNFWQWWTRDWDNDRNLIAVDIKLADGVGGGHAVVADKLNVLLGFTIEEEEGDEGGSGLSSTGGTSVVSFRLEHVQYALESAAGDTSTNYLRSETGDYFISEDLNTVLQRSDNTFLSVDTRSVDHGGSGGGAGNPVTSGAVAGNTMTLTLNDTSTVDIDVTSLVVPDGITVDSPNWFQMFSSPGNGNSASGSQINFTTHQAADVDKNPYYWGTDLQPGQELIWTATTGPKDICLGIWAGATTYVPTPNASAAGSDTSFHADNWTKKLRFFGGSDYIFNVGSGLHTTGFNVGPTNASDWWYTPNSSVFALRYDNGDHKLRLFEISSGMDYLVAEAISAEDGSNKTISAAFGIDSGSQGTVAIPQFTQRDYMYTFVHRASATTNELWRDGMVIGDVVKYNRTLRPGYKLKFTTTAGTASTLWHMFDYTGTAIGQTNPHDATSASLKWTSTSQFTDSDNVGGWTANTGATRYSASNTTSAMANVLVSWRYHPTTNVIDLYDEGNEEILFTKDVAADGNPVSLFIATNPNSAVAADRLPQSFTLDRHDFWENRNHSLPGLTQGYDDWFTDVGPRSGLHAWNRANAQASSTPQWKDQPFKWDRLLRPGESFIFEPNITTTDAFLQLGVGTHTETYQNRNDNGAWAWNIKFDQNDINSQTGWEYATESFEPGYGNHTASPFVKIDGQVAHNDTVEFHYNATDNKVYGYVISDGPHKMLIGRSIAAHDGNPITISCSASGNGYKWSLLPTFAMGGHAWYTQLADESGSLVFRQNTSYPKDSVDSTYTPLRWGRTLHPGDEMNWLHSNHRTDTQAHHFGILKTSVSTPGSMSNVSNWDYKVAIQGDRISKALTNGCIGFDIDTYQTATIASNVSAGDTSIAITDATDWPDDGTFEVGGETITYTSRSGNTLTCNATSGAHSADAVCTKIGFKVIYNTDTFSLRYDPVDYKLRLYKTTGSVDQLITTSTAAPSNTGVGLKISLGGNGPNMAVITHQRTPSALGTGVSRWYSRHGKRAGRGLVDNIDHSTSSDQPAIWGEWLRPGEEICWVHPTDYASGTSTYKLGQWIDGKTDNGNSANEAENHHWQFRFQFDRVVAPDGGSNEAKGVDLAADWLTLTPGTTKFALRYDHTDNKIRLFDITGDNEILVGATSSALDGNPFQLCTTGSTNRKRPVMEPKRKSRWELVYEIYPGYNENRLTHHWSGGIGAYSVFKSNTLLHKGYRIRWKLPLTARNYSQMGVWSAGNQSYGYYNIAATVYWDWSFFTNSYENFYMQDDGTDWTWNTSATGYTSATPNYIDYNPGVTEMEIRYNSDNSLTIWDVTADNLVATKNVNADGNPLQLYFANSDNDDIVSGSVVDDVFGEYDVGPIDSEDTNWHQLYQGAGNGSSVSGGLIDTTAPPAEGNPYRFGTTLKRGYEFIFPVSFNEETCFWGIWKGATTYNAAQGGKASYWHKHIRYSSSNDEIRHGTNAYDSVGWDLTDDYSVTHGTTQLCLRYDYTTMKLQMWDITGNREKLICTASVAEDGNPVTISAAVNGTSSLPAFTVREQDFDIIATRDLTDISWRDGVLSDTVVKRNEAIHPGQKMSCTLLAAWQNQYMGFDYTGATFGQTSVETNSTYLLQMDSAERMFNKAGFTINTSAQRYDSGTGYMLAMGGVKISVRYHIDNSIDVYDEVHEEVLFTRNVAGNGNPIYLNLTVAATINAGYWNTTWSRPEKFASAWYSHHGSNVIATAKPAVWFTQQNFNGGGNYQVWGELMYPGQEMLFTHDQPGAYQTEIGRRNGINTSWDRALTFTTRGVSNVTGFDLSTTYEEADNILLETDVGLGADELLLQDGYKVVQEAATLETKWALRYTKGDNKLKLWQIEKTTGKETLISTADTAEDGNAIEIHAGGAGRAFPMEIRYYGWEFIHEYVVLPWQNWRADRPTANDELANDAVVRSTRSLNPGEYLKWTTPQSQQAGRYGQWKSSNPATGITGVENETARWDWGIKRNNIEQLEVPIGMTFNTANTNYDANSGAPFWLDPNPGTTEVAFRYHSTNKLDLYDYTNNAIIATKDEDLDGSPFFLDFGNGVGTGTVNMADDFFGGGDVTIAKSVFAPTFTSALNYDDDGILNAAEMVKLDTTVPVGKRMIIHPEFWGLLEDMGGVVDSGPASAGSGWVENDVVIIGWQKANSPHFGTNIGNSNSGWDAAMYMQLRGAGTNHTSRIAEYSPGTSGFNSRDGRTGVYYFTDLYFTFDRIAANSGRVMAFPTQAAARIGIAGTSPETTWYANSNDEYMTGNAATLTLTSDFYLYIYSQTGNFTLPITTSDCIEVVSIPT